MHLYEELQLMSRSLSLSQPSVSSISRLELLSTITEIRGPLEIWGWPEQTFPYLRNLQKIGHPNGTTRSLPPGCPDDYSLLIFLNAQLQQIDLSSLESISGGGILFLGNPELCYVGNLSTYLDNQMTQPQCLGRTQPFRKDPQTCSECHNSNDLL